MFGNMMNVPSLADIAAVTRGNNNNNGFGDGGWMWAWIIIFALFGWGDGGFGFGNGNGRGSSSTVAMEAAMQRGFDTNTIINKLDGISNGLCSLGYDQLAQMNSLGREVMQSGFNTQLLFNQGQIAQMQSTNALSTQMQQCCCNIERLLADSQYQRAADTCDIKTAIGQMGQAVMQNDNCNWQKLMDRLTDMQMQSKDETIAQLRQLLNNCDRDNALQSLEARLTQRLDPTPVPSFTVPNPNGCRNGGNNNQWEAFIAGLVAGNDRGGFGWGNGCCNNGWGFGFGAA